MNIDTLKGIGPKTSKIFESNGIITINDLMSYYPFRYDVIKRSNINELIQDDKIIIDGIVESNPSLFFFNKKMNKMTFKFIFNLADAFITFGLIFFVIFILQSLSLEKKQSKINAFNNHTLTENNNEDSSVDKDLNNQMTNEREEDDKL